MYKCHGRKYDKYGGLLNIQKKIEEYKKENK